MVIWPVNGSPMQPAHRVKLPQLRLSICQAAWLRRLALSGSYQVSSVRRASDRHQLNAEPMARADGASSSMEFVGSAIIHPRAAHCPFNRVGNAPRVQ